MANSFPTLTFLPWMRRGLSAEITDVDTGQTSFPRSPELDVWVTIDDHTAHADVSLRPADHVTGLQPGQIVRRYPGPNAGNAEFGYWPLIELSAPDLPWVMTPLAPDESGDSRLRPWLVLVCVPVGDVEFMPAEGNRPATIIADADQLGDLSRSAEWAHVQSTVPANDAAAAADTPGVALARIVAPVALGPGTTYRAALVPAFTPNGDDLEPAWSLGDGAVEVPVFDTWTFTTGIAESFEALVTLLEAVDSDLDLDLGINPVNVTDLGAIDPWPDEDLVEIDYAGALIDTDLEPIGLRGLVKVFNDAVEPLLEQGDHRVLSRPRGPDPVVTPPLYGAYAAETHEVPDVEDAKELGLWLRQVNMTVRHRIAAGLGARIVQIHQERFMAQAWKQAGQIVEARRALNAARLQAEIGRRWKARAAELDPDQQLHVLKSQLGFVRLADDEPARAALADSGIPNGLHDPAYQRVTRSGTAVSRASGRRADRFEGPPLDPSDPEYVHRPAWRNEVGTTFGRPVDRNQMRFGAVDAPAGTVLTAHRHLDPDQLAESGQNIYRGTAASRFSANAPDRLRTADVAATAQVALSPMQAGRGRVDQRVSGLGALLDARGFPTDEIPTRPKIGPRIDEALMWSLIRMSPELLMPGIGDFPENSVRLVEANAAFVAAFLAGANHEMSRELLWREFPAVMGSTTFRRFWDRAPGDTDIEPMADWQPDQGLSDLGDSMSAEEDPKGTAGMLVLLARGDVFRLYPTMVVYLRDDTTGVVTLPAFGGRIPPDVRFFAFEVDDVDHVIESDTWTAVFEEQPAEPRFGEDDDVTISYANSASVAATAYQRPFRYEFPVATIVGHNDA
ncbi:MAG: hypothetical protein AAF467_22335 [Actinomycetota bacterium]